VLRRELEGELSATLQSPRSGAVEGIE
jgi:hypothetical protein